MTRKPWVLGGVSVLVLLAFLYMAASFVVLERALVVKARPFEHAPEDLGLVHESVSFTPRGEQELVLRGWWMPADQARGTVIWVHGLDGNRAARLPFLKRLVDNGFNVLSFDLRGHGESDFAPMGAGLHEQRDLQGAIDFVTGALGQKPGSIFLVGSSFGAAISLLVGVDEPAIAGVHADSSFASLSEMITVEVARRTILPTAIAGPLKPGLVLAGRLVRGIDLDEVRPVHTVARYPFMLGIAHCHGDDRIPYAHAQAIRANAPSGSFFESYSCGHADAFDFFPDDYTDAVLRYLNTRLGQITP